MGVYSLIILAGLAQWLERTSVQFCRRILLLNTRHYITMFNGDYTTYFSKLIQRAERRQER